MPIQRLAKCSATQIGAARALYESAFPASERDDFHNIVAADSSGDIRALILLDASADVQALCIASEISVPAIYLQYFAVHDSLRGQGIGTRFLEQSLDVLRSGRRLGVVLEVERPAAAPEDAYRIRRLRFWTKNGAVKVIERLLVPRLDGEGKEEMSILWISADGDRTVPPSLLLARLVLREGYVLPDETVSRLMASVEVEGTE